LRGESDFGRALFQPPEGQRVPVQFVRPFVKSNKNDYVLAGLATGAMANRRTDEATAISGGTPICARCSCTGPGLRFCASNARIVSGTMDEGAWKAEPKVADQEDVIGKYGQASSRRSAAQGSRCYCLQIFPDST